jgi:hypothetical protein
MPLAAAWAGAEQNQAADQHRITQSAPHRARALGLLADGKAEQVDFGKTERLDESRRAARLQPALHRTMDHWDPAVTDGFAKDREVILFNNAGVSSSSGEVPATFADMRLARACRSLRERSCWKDILSI